MKTLGILGYGVMGEAFARGLCRAFPEARLLIAEKTSDRKEAVKALPKGEIKTPEEVYEQSEVVLFAVKPQDIDALLKGLPRVPDKYIISIAAGKSIEGFSQALGTKQAARFMPNIAASIGKASVAVSFGNEAREDFRTTALSIAGAVGTAWEIAESLMGAFTGLSGSGIAYVYAFAQAMTLGGIAEGIPYEKALPIVIETLESAAALLKVSGESPAALITKVASPAGTTIAGIECLERGGLTAAVMAAVKRTAERSRELEGA